MSSNPSLQLCSSVEEAMSEVPGNCTVMVGGFGLNGIPENILDYIAEQPNARNFTIISNDGGSDTHGLGKLYKKAKIARHRASYIGKVKSMQHAYLTGEVELDLIPQGTLAEKIRCCGAGIPAFFTSTGKDTLYAEGKLPIRFNKDGSVAKYNSAHQVHNFGGKDYILEPSFQKADFAWVKASKVDTMGNCIFKGTSYNFNGIMARAARNVIVEAEELVEAGQIPPEQVHLPGLYVDKAFQGKYPGRSFDVAKPLENLVSSSAIVDRNGVRSLIARVVAQELVAGAKCNLGVGIPTLAAAYAAQRGVHVYLQAENGALGYGPYSTSGKEDGNWTNAGSESIRPLHGASTFGSDESFAQIRGGHLDLTILGALECSHKGDIANFMIPGKLITGMGGAMDLVSNPDCTNVIVVQTHVDKYGHSKIKETCTLPVTGKRCVRKIITDLAVFDVDFETGLTLRKYNPDTSIEAIRAKTGAPFLAEGSANWFRCPEEIKRVQLMITQ